MISIGLDFIQKQYATYWCLPQINWHKSSTFPKPGKTEKRKHTENDRAVDPTVILVVKCNLSTMQEQLLKSKWKSVRQPAANEHRQKVVAAIKLAEVLT